MCIEKLRGVSKNRVQEFKILSLSFFVLLLKETKKIQNAQYIFLQEKT